MTTLHFFRTPGRSRWLVALAAIYLFLVEGTPCFGEWRDGGVPTSYIDLRDQGMHYLKVGKRALALESLEKSLKSGGDEDERLILALAKLHQDDGNVKRAFEVLEAGPATAKVNEYREQLNSQYSTVELTHEAGQDSRIGYLYLAPDKPIINPEKKAFFQAMLDGPLSGKLKLPLEVILPTGQYRANGTPLKVVAGGRTRAEVPFADLGLIVGKEPKVSAASIAGSLERELGTSLLRVADLSLPEQASLKITEMATREPDLLIAVGLDALTRAYKDLRSIPLLVLDVEEEEGARFINKHGHATAVWNNPPRRRLFERLRELKPDISRIGVVLNRERSWAIYEAVLSDRPPEIRFVPALVTNKGGIATNLLRLKPHIDAIWILPDSQLFDDRAVQLIASWGYKEKIPLLVEQIDLVRQGALLGGEIRWSDLLTAGTAQARKILWEQQAPASLPSMRIQEPSWGLSHAVCRHLDLEAPAELLQSLAIGSEEMPKLETAPRKGSPKK